MHGDLAVLGQIAILVLAAVALFYWQWYEYQAALISRRCKASKCGSAGDNTQMEDFIVTDTSEANNITIDSIEKNDQNKRMRLRDLGVQPGVLPTGPNNAITDAGVLVGHTTLIEGDGTLVPGKGPVRTGVTVIIPHRGDVWNSRASAGHFVLNGNGAVTGLDWIAECGLLEGPVALTNTHSVGDVYSGLLRWMVSKHPDIGVNDDTYLPVVGECDDSPLNDIQGMHVRAEHVAAALDGASGGRVPEGTVGAGTGMTCYDFKGGIGTSSRVVTIDGSDYTVGVLVNCNHGGREQLKMLGRPVGQILEAEEKATRHVEGSIVIVVATDAPLSSRQLDRVAKRAALGLALTGATANNSSGDFVIAFSNGRLVPRTETAKLSLEQLNDAVITPIFHATVEATEEAVLNSLCMASTVVGRDGNISPALPLERVREILK
jgi:D-aminopeptidase